MTFYSLKIWHRLPPENKSSAVSQGQGQNMSLTLTCVSFFTAFEFWMWNILYNRIQETFLSISVVEAEEHPKQVLSFQQILSAALRPSAPLGEKRKKGTVIDSFSSFSGGKKEEKNIQTISKIFIKFVSVLKSLTVMILSISHITAYSSTLFYFFVLY